MAKNTVNAGFMVGANFYSDNAETAPYLKKGFLGQKFPLNCDTVANIEVVDAQGRRDTASAVTRGVAGAVLLGGVGAIAGLMSSKGLITVIIKLKNGASLTGEIDQGVFQGLQRHAMDWGTKGVKEPGGAFDGYAKKKEREALEARAKYGPGYDKTIKLIKPAIIAMMTGALLLALTEYAQMGQVFIFLGLLLLAYSIIWLCRARYKTSKARTKDTPENNKTTPTFETDMDLEAYVKKMESKASEAKAEARAKYGPGHYKIMTVLKVAILAMIAAVVLLGTSERFISLGAILLILGFFSTIYSLIWLCWARYKISKE